jgi:hypothetical protein
MSQRTSGGTTRHPSPAPGNRARPDDAGDEYLADVLIRMWALASGRTLRRDVPPDQLSTEELTAFWADDMTPQAGRHARLDTPDRIPSTRVTALRASRAPQRRSRTRRRRPSRGTARNRHEHPAGPAAA